MKKLLNLWVLLALIAGASVTGTATGDDRPGQWEDDDYAYDRARRAVARGEMLPMGQLLDWLQTQVPGEVVGLELEREHGQWVYEFKVIDTEGRLLEVYMDAKTGNILATEDG